MPRERERDAEALLARYGDDLTTFDLSGRLRCTACGGTGRLRVNGSPGETSLYG